MAKLRSSLQPKQSYSEWDRLIFQHYEKKSANPQTQLVTEVRDLFNISGEQY